MAKDTLPTGYKEIVNLVIGNVRVCILGEVKDLSTKADIEDNYTKYKSSSSVKVSFQCGVDFTDDNHRIVICESGSEDIDSDTLTHVSVCMPVFCEYTEYTFAAEIIEPQNDDTISLWHENQNIRNKMKYIFNKKSAINGGFSFDGDIGYSDFVIRVNGKDYVTITVEVFPSKISYKEDYDAIRKDIVEEFYALIFDALKKTYSGFQLSAERRPSKLEFYSIFRVVYKEYINAVDQIIQKTHHQLQTDYNIVPIHKAKRIDNKSVAWIQKHPANMRVLDDGKFAIDKILAVKKYVSYDTKENRFTKHIIEKTVWRLNEFKKGYLELISNTNDEFTRKEDKEFVKSIDNQIAVLGMKVRNSFLSEVCYQNEQVQMSLIFAMAPGYRELYKCYLKLERALKLLDEVYKMSQKDIARLYEYWCFIKLNSIVSEKLQANKKKSAIIGVDQIIAKLSSKSSSKIVYPIDDKNEVNLYYNLMKGNLPTVTQKPDNVLTIRRTGASEMQYVFDAKYKIGTNKYTKEVGPTDDDINTMHRYRDAIVSNEEGIYARDMIGAYVLFPFADKDKQYTNHPYYKSIETVNIGALPFLPSQTEYVEEIIDRLIKNSDQNLTNNSAKQLMLLQKYYQEMRIGSRPI